MSRLLDVTPRLGHPEDVDWALDTETQNGKAILVTVSGPGPDGKDVAYWWEPTGFANIFETLAGYARKFMAYNMDYDSRAFIKWLPESLWKGLYATERTEWRGFHISYRQGRHFKVSKEGRSFAVFDLAVHFQKPLAVACRDLLKREVKSKIPKSWYPRMAAVLKNPQTRPRVIKYALDDATAPRQLWVELRSQFEKLGVPAEALQHPVSPGSIAAAYFGDKLRFDLDSQANGFARKAYAGGRIEVFRRGFFPRVWIYDLKSAYPWALAKLPDPRGLDFVQDEADRDDAVYSVFKVRVNIGRDCFIPPVPVWHPKKSQSLRIYPCGKYTAWVTEPERRVLARNGWLDDVLAGAYLVGERKPWLTEIPRLFRERKRNPGISQAVKLVLNSIYGKLAQVDERYGNSEVVGGGMRMLPGTFLRKYQTYSATTNFFVAAYVTALCRLRVWEVLHAQPGAAVMAATDAVMLTKPLGFPTGENLGEWSLQAARAKAVVVGTGIYSSYYDGEWHDKMRGHRLKEPLRDVLRTDRTKVAVKSQIAYTLGDYFTKGADLNVIAEVPRTLDINFDEKRIWPGDWKRGRDVLRGAQTSRPPLLLDADAQGRLK
jgi:DNA polymerase family B